MEPQGRVARKIAITSSFHRLYEAAINPNYTQRQLDKLSSATLLLLDNLLDEEYNQGRLDMKVDFDGQG